MGEGGGSIQGREMIVSALLLMSGITGIEGCFGFVLRFDCGVVIGTY